LQQGAVMVVGARAGLWCVMVWNGTVGVGLRGTGCWCHEHSYVDEGVICG